MKKILKPKPLLIIILLVLILMVGGFIGTWFYLQSPVDASDNKIIEVEIKSGTTSTGIGEILKEKKLIKSVTLFKVYLKINHVGSLKASTYKFKKSMSLEEIVEELEVGVISNDNAVKMTFKDGERITDFAKVISNTIDMDYDSALAVFKDREYVKTLIPKYWFLTDEILNENIYYPLEGYLAPETYLFDPDATIYDIIERLLKQTEKNLEDYQDMIKDNPHYYITMASIAQLEGTNAENRKMIVGVFQNRLNSGFNLGSDVTTYYALQKSMKEDLTADEIATVNPYNTRGANMIGKMPVGPICNPNPSSIEAAVYPTENDYFFFVADKNGKIYFTKTNAEHNQKVAEIKANGDWIFD